MRRSRKPRLSPISRLSGSFLLYGVAKKRAGRSIAVRTRGASFAAQPQAPFVSADKTDRRPFGKRPVSFFRKKLAPVLRAAIRAGGRADSRCRMAEYTAPATLFFFGGGILMGFWQTLATSLLIAFVLPVVFSIFWFFKVRGEKKMPSKDRIRTRPPKAVSGFFLGFALLVLFGGIAGIIYCCITDSENTTVQAVIVLSVCIAVFSALAFSAKRDFIAMKTSAVFMIRPDWA